MGGFSDVTLEWQGNAYVIPARKVLRAIAGVEEVVTLKELAGDVNGQKIKMARLASAFATALRSAGANVTDDDVYVGMFEGGASADAAMAAVTGLLAIMIPPSAYAKAAEEKAPEPGKA